VFSSCLLNGLDVICCCWSTITFIYQPETPHIVYHQGKTSGIGILEITKLSTPLQTILLKYDGETRLVKLKPSNEWSICRGSRRGRLEIMAEILLFCTHQKAKTNIMYRINLNYTQLKSNLKFLTSQGLLNHNMGKYATTEKGYRYLELFAELNDILTF
jgi:predicted transcriptional regulator